MFPWVSTELPWVCYSVWYSYGNSSICFDYFYALMMAAKSKGRIILCGGYDDNGKSDKCYKYDNTTNAWNLFTTMGRKRSLPTLTQINEDTFWIAGRTQTFYAKTFTLDSTRIMYCKIVNTLVYYGNDDICLIVHVMR